MEMADNLLRNTRQYQTWERVRQTDPRRAEKIARLILQRRNLMKAPQSAAPAARQQFDQVTEQLQLEGIFLYKSHQFKTPVFSAAAHTQTIARTPRSVPPPGAAPVAQDRLRAFNQRFPNKDCYEFLAAVLEENGIAYYGKGGLAERLMTKALAEGRKPNRYFTGEGVTEALCQQRHSVRVSETDAASAGQIWAEISPHLRDGGILSFSSRDFGHTGLVEQRNGRWVYLNSTNAGRGRNGYRVVEEDLRSEIKSWLRRARRNATFLDITVGKVAPQKIRPFELARMEAVGRLHGERFRLRV